MSKTPKDEATLQTLKNVGRCTVTFIIVSTVLYSMTHAKEIKVIIGTFLYWTQGLGAWGLAVLLAAYIVCVVLMIPTTLLNLGVGYSFGVWFGFPAMLLGGAVGASIAFFLGRTLARECIASSFYRYNIHIRRIDQGLLQGRDAWRFVFLSRVPPCMPFPVLNYLYGTTGVEFYTYISATAAGLAPGTFMYVYTGHAIRSLVDLLSGDPKALGLQYQVLFVVGMVLTVLVSMYLANEARLVGNLPLPSEGKPSVLHEGPHLDSEITQTGVPGSHGVENERNWAQEVPDEEVGLLEVEEPIKPAGDSEREDQDDGFVVWLSTFDVRTFSNSVMSVMQ